MREVAVARLPALAASRRSRTRSIRPARNRLSCVALGQPGASVAAVTTSSAVSASRPLRYVIPGADVCRTAVSIAGSASRVRRCVCRTRCRRAKRRGSSAGVGSRRPSRAVALMPSHRLTVPADQPAAPSGGSVSSCSHCHGILSGAAGSRTPGPTGTSAEACHGLVNDVVANFSLCRIAPATLSTPPALSSAAVPGRRS